MSDEEALEQGELSGKAAQVLMRLLCWHDSAGRI
jgi:hypothetical protein